MRSVFRKKMAHNCPLTTTKSSQEQLFLMRLRKSSCCPEVKPSSVSLGVWSCHFENIEPPVPEGGDAEQSWKESVWRNLLPNSTGGKSALSQSQAWMGKSLLFLLTSGEGGRLFFQPQTPESPPWPLYIQPWGTDCSWGLARVLFLNSSLWVPKLQYRVSSDTILINIYQRCFIK